MVISSPSEGLTSIEAFCFDSSELKTIIYCRSCWHFLNLSPSVLPARSVWDVATSSISKDFSRNHHRCTVEMCCWLKGCQGIRFQGIRCPVVPSAFWCIVEIRFVNPDMILVGFPLAETNGRCYCGAFISCCCALSAFFLLVFSVFQAGRCRIPLWPLGWWWVSGGCSLSSSSPRTRPTSQPSSPSHA